jgi:hypothetical protein
MKKRMTEGSLLQTMLQECMQALACMSDLYLFTAQASWNPSVYLGVLLARRVPEGELEGALLISFKDFEQCWAAMQKGRREAWERLMLMDDLIISMARMYTLYLRCGDSCGWQGEKANWLRRNWRLMRNRSPRWPGGFGDVAAG